MTRSELDAAVAQIAAAIIKGDKETCFQLCEHVIDQMEDDRQGEEFLAERQGRVIEGFAALLNIGERH